MVHYKIAPEYSEQYLQVDRPQPLTDNSLEQTINDIVKGSWDNDISDNIYTDFNTECHNYLFNNTLNKLTGIEHFPVRQNINGCTQYIDNLYMKHPVQTLLHDYRYHSRLNLGYIKTVGNLIPNIPLILAMPFPSTGDVHIDIDEILDECKTKDIPVHIDGCWLSCSRDISFDFSHPSIQSVGVSLSKGLGLGWNRVGLRYSRQETVDSISIHNTYKMNVKVAYKIGLHFIRNYPQDYLWNKHKQRYETVCKDFNLTPTKSIYLALRNGQPVGVSPLIRYLENNE